MNKGDPKDLVGRKCPWGYNTFGVFQNRTLTLCPYKTCPYIGDDYTGIICTAYDRYGGNE